MPKIRLENTQDDHWWIRALMLFPNDHVHRENCLLLNEIQIGLDGAGENDLLEVGAGTLRKLLHAPTPEAMKGMEAAATKRAIYAGDILASMYLMSLFEDESEAFRRPSMGKAIHVSMQFSLGKKFGDGDKMHYSESKIRECWDEYKSVAHLWAAYRITQAYPLPGGEGNAAVKIGSIDFLKVAAGIYKFGVNFIPKGARPALPILDESTSWTLPDSIPSVHLANPQFPDELAKHLSAYKAK